MNVEFSFTAFSHFEPLPLGKSKELLSFLPSRLRSLGIPVVYFQEVKLSALDSSLAAKNLHKGLNDRLQSYPNRKQVLIHLFDNIASGDFLIQDRGRNEASFTSDMRGFKPRKQQINKSLPLSHTLTTGLAVSEVKSLLPSFEFELLDHEKLYVDNFIFYSSLSRSQSSGVLPLLVYIPSSLSDPNPAVEFIVALCQSIRTVLLNSYNIS